MSNFDIAIEHLLSPWIEGGYSNDPNDPGGETAFGISKKSYPEIDIKSLTREQAIEIYRQKWWNPYGFEGIHHPEIATQVFKLAVNAGMTAAVKCLQRAVNGTGEARPELKVDGIMGPETLAAVNHQNIWLHARAFLLALFRIEAVQHYLVTGKKKYRLSWIRRALT